MKKLLVFLLCAGLMACQRAPLVANTQPFDVEGPKYRFNVSRVEVVDDFEKALRSRREVKPDVSLAETMHKWSDERLVAVGSENVLEVHITDADIAKKDVPKQKTGVEGFFTKEQTESYEGKLSVELKLYTPERSLPMAHAEISAEASRSLREDANVEDRKRIYRAMTAELMKQMDEALDRNIRQYFSAYLQ